MARPLIDVGHVLDQHAQVFLFFFLYLSSEFVFIEQVFLSLKD